MSHALNTSNSFDRHGKTRAMLAALAGAAAIACGAASVAIPASAEAATESATESGSVAASVVRKVNAERADRGCRPVKASSKLARAARGHAADMAKHGYFSHPSLDGRTWDKRIRNAGYSKPGGENIAYGQKSAAEVMADWMNSPGHRRNILDCDFRYIGVGHATSADSVEYWVQDFGY